MGLKMDRGRRLFDIVAVGSGTISFLMLAFAVDLMDGNLFVFIGLSIAGGLLGALLPFFGLATGLALGIVIALAASGARFPTAVLVAVPLMTGALAELASRLAGYRRRPIQDSPKTTGPEDRTFCGWDVWLVVSAASSLILLALAGLLGFAKSLVCVATVLTVVVACSVLVAIRFAGYR